MMVFVLWLLVIGGVAVFLFGKSKYDELPEEHKESVRKLTDIEEHQKHAEAEYKKLQVSIAADSEWLNAQMKVAQAKRDKIVRIQKDLEGILGFFTRQEYKRDLEEEKASLEEFERKLQEVSKRIISQKEASEEARGRKEALDSELVELKEQVAEEQEELTWWDQKKESGLYWLRKAFEVSGKTLILVTLAILVLPLLFKIILYYIVAPLMGMARPIRIDSDNYRRIGVSDTSVAKEISLKSGEFAIIKPQFHQASDDRLKKKTKFVFDWRYPFTSMACGLIEMTRVENTDEENRVLTLSSQEEAEVELAVLDIPDDGSVILRPRYLVGFCGREDRPPRIRTHWKLFSLHSWLTLQFRYFEFEGPGQLAVWALRGVRAEIMTKRDIEQQNRKRTNQDATIGFTPTLKYHSIKAETFWSYFRGQNPLFDDIFTGEGTFLCQQISRGARGGIVRRFWEGLWNGITKIFGI